MACNLLLLKGLLMKLFGGSLITIAVVFRVVEIKTMFWAADIIFLSGPNAVNILLSINFYELNGFGWFLIDVFSDDKLVVFPK